MQPGWCQPVRQEFMENECEALPGVAYPGVRDNRSTINTKTGYDDDFVKSKAAGDSTKMLINLNALFYNDAEGSGKVARNQYPGLNHKQKLCVSMKYSQMHSRVPLALPLFVNNHWVLRYILSVCCLL